MLKSGGQLELAGVITIELASFHPSTAAKNGFDPALESGWILHGATDL